MKTAVPLLPWPDALSMAVACAVATCARAYVLNEFTIEWHAMEGIEPRVFTLLPQPVVQVLPEPPRPAAVW